MSSEAGAPTVTRNKWTYTGPGLAEWVLGGLCTAMIADTLTRFGQMNEPQTAAFYYGKVSGVIPLQWIGVVLNVSILLLIVGWIATQRKESPLQAVIMAVSALGGGLIWTELMLARSTQPNDIYVLTSLPFQPVGAWGLAGAQAYFTYLLFKLPDGRLNAWMGAALKTGFAICVWLVQMSVWDMLWRTVAK